MVSDFTYNAITTDFWANLDAVGAQETYDFPGTALVPPMKIEDFRITSISPAV